MPEVIEDPSKVIDDVLNLVFGFVEPFFEVGSCTKMSLDTTSENTGSEGSLLIDGFDGVVELIEGKGTSLSRSTERAFLSLGLSSSSLAT